MAQFFIDRPIFAWVLAIVGLHAAPGGQTGFNHDDWPGYPLVFYVPRERQRAIKLWRAIAQRYAGDPIIVGYDLLNEPIAPLLGRPSRERSGRVPWSESSGRAACVCWRGSCGCRLLERGRALLRRHR